MCVLECIYALGALSGLRGDKRDETFGIRPVFLRLNRLLLCFSLVASQFPYILIQSCSAYSLANDDPAMNVYAELPTFWRITS